MCLVVQANWHAGPGVANLGSESHSKSEHVLAKKAGQNQSNWFLTPQIHRSKAWSVGEVIVQGIFAMT